jgi:hypothetical protein
MKTKTKKTPKTQKTPKANAPLTSKEFRDAISKMTRKELVGILCDIYYPKANNKGGCGCDCGCGGDSKKTPKAKKSAKV